MRKGAFHSLKRALPTCSSPLRHTPAHGLAYQEELTASRANATPQHGFVSLILMHGASHSRTACDPRFKSHAEGLSHWKIISTSHSRMSAEWRDLACALSRRSISRGCPPQSFWPIMTLPNQLNGDTSRFTMISRAPPAVRSLPPSRVIIRSPTSCLIRSPTSCQTSRTANATTPIIYMRNSVCASERPVGLASSAATATCRAGKTPSSRRPPSLNTHKTHPYPCVLLFTIPSRLNLAYQLFQLVKRYLLVTDEG